MMPFALGHLLSQLGAHLARLKDSQIHPHRTTAHVHHLPTIPAYRQKYMLSLGPLLNKMYWFWEQLLFPEMESNLSILVGLEKKCTIVDWTLQ